MIPDSKNLVPDDEILIDGPEPTDAALDLPAFDPKLERPEHEGEALGDFGETVVDNDGEVKPELLDEPDETG